MRNFVSICILSITLASACQAIEVIPIERHYSPMRSLLQLSKLNGLEQGGDIIPVKNLNNLVYVGQVNIGTPPQKFLVQLDTGSANLWITSSSCTIAACANKRKYNARASSTSVVDGRSINIAYGKGSTSGVVYKDTVTLGSLGVKNFAFGNMNILSNAFAPANYDGLLGLAFRSISEDNLPTFVDQLHATNQLPSYAYSFYMTDQQLLGSALILGGTSSKYYTGAIHYHKVITPRFWTIKLASMKINGQNMFNTGYGYGLVDSGTSLISGDLPVIKNVAAALKVPDSGVPCSTVSSYPTVNFSIDNLIYKLPPSYYFFKLKQFGKTTCLPSFSVLPLSDAGNQVLLGDTFMRAFYSVFDLGNQRVGFAVANHGNGVQADDLIEVIE